MTLPISSASRNSNFEDFLFTDIGAQPNGLPLTVLSLFARAGLDPWAEAEQLSRMSRSVAVSHMIAAINRAPAMYRSHLNVTELAEELVGRLPEHGPVRPLDVSFAGTGFEGAPTVALMMMFYALFTLGLLALLLEKG
jgi:hypothetical protein